MVQLGGVINRVWKKLNIYFNSTMVQLGESLLNHLLMLLSNFNSTMVQLGGAVDLVVDW